MRKWTYNFGLGRSEGSASDSALLGAKGANLAELGSLGLPVPPGMTIIADACTWFHEHECHFPDTLLDQVAKGLNQIEESTGKRFGAAHNPLFLSVRPGTRVPVPGMTGTVLNIGLNDQTVQALAKETGDVDFAWSTYRRFIATFADLAMGLDHAVFEELLEEKSGKSAIANNPGLSVEQWRQVIEAGKAIVLDEMGETFPQDPQEQLWAVIAAAFKSWTAPRAEAYRKLHSIPVDWGTAVNIQAMVFGNRNGNSMTGNAITRNPKTGASGVTGTFLPRAQGYELSTGDRAPHQISERGRKEAERTEMSLEAMLPEAYETLEEMTQKLERHYRDVVELEFTVDDGYFWILESRLARCDIRARMRSAVDMVHEGLINREEALTRIDPLELEQLLHPAIDPSVEREVIGTGLPASPGAAAGEIVFNAEDAVHAAKEGRRVILVRSETSPEDVYGMHAAEGVLTSRGGLTSHAAVVARGMGIPCVAGAGAVRIDAEAGTMTSMGVTLKKGDHITIDGSVGQIIRGQTQMVQPELAGDFAKLMEWSDAVRRMGVRTNADTSTEARVARKFGAEGIGLCRTEHMFFEENRINVVREMILAEDEDGRRQSLEKLLPMQRSDFIELFEIMHGLPVTIRLLDPPLHEFLPKVDSDVAEMAERMGLGEEELRRRIEAMHEFNPMLGHRGCRLAISYPEIAEMQARAIFEAAVEAAKSTGAPVVPEIMVPLVSLRRELDYVKARIEQVADDVAKETGVFLNYLVGTMIELPRAAFRGQEIAQAAEFFSFGTNDLTQTVFGISRDDAGGFLTTYRQKGIIEKDPFVSLDYEGVGEIIKLASERGRAGRHDLKLGICGEHAGDPASIHFCEATGLDYISCSPYRVPVARLAAAQATIYEGATPKAAVY
ncbi:pyruvate, phosphate dikinase [Rhizobium sp. L1K21]|uniref:pyruvate, phosphate dikinase n=1 Tax=Rhizobium sp. L1K21 TaxID=2954933 RepID=UPI0020937E56|nr:pyruvate, phosphate dikinase [Rhizobium sp. L1K21]MCO6186960.1 pyruvate, phosphate dikinase [Rhizobium sp. L1K21]